MSKKRTLIFFDYHRRITGEHAFMMAGFLEAIVESLWREIGDDMAVFQSRVFPDEPPSPYLKYCKHRSLYDDDDHF